MNTKRQRFVDAYTAEAAGNATKAAEIAGFKAGPGLATTAYRLLKNAEVRQAIDARCQTLQASVAATSERILQEVSDVALTKVEVKGSEKMKALELLGRYRKLWQDKSTDSASRITVNIGFLSTHNPEPHATTSGLLPVITLVPKE
jgi:hypothetical protein